MKKTAIPHKGTINQASNSKKRTHPLVSIINGNPIEPTQEKCSIKSLINSATNQFRNANISIGDPSNICDVTPYENVVYRTLRQRELENPQKPYKTKILLANRNNAIDSISYMTFRLGYSTNCFYLAVGLLNKLLSAKSIKLNELKIYCFAAVFAASKIEEVYPHSGNTLIKEGNHCFQKKEYISCLDLFKAERDLLGVIDFSCTEGTPLFFLTYHLRIIKADYQTILLSRFVLEVIQTDDRFLMIIPSKQAAVAQIAACAILEKERWPEILVQYTGFTEEDLVKPLAWIRSDLVQKDRQSSFYIRWKYSTDLFDGVSTIEIPSSFK